MRNARSTARKNATSASSYEKHTRTKTERKIGPDRSGWSIAEYFPHAVGFGGRTTFYALPEEEKPRHIKVGRILVITEPPREYIKRLEQIAAKRPIELRAA